MRITYRHEYVAVNRRTGEHLTNEKLPNILNALRCIGYHVEHGNRIRTLLLTEGRYTVGEWEVNVQRWAVEKR